MLRIAVGSIGLIGGARSAEPLRPMAKHPAAIRGSRSGPRIAALHPPGARKQQVFKKYKISLTAKFVNRRKIARSAVKALVYARHGRDLMG